MRTLATTQFSVHHTAKVAARQMIKAGEGGRIVLIGSIMAEMAAETASACKRSTHGHLTVRAYGHRLGRGALCTDTSSKVAIRKLGEIMAHELAGHQIT